MRLSRWGWQDGSASSIRLANSLTRPTTLTSATRIVSSWAARQNDRFGAKPRRVCSSQ